MSFANEDSFCYFQVDLVLERKVGSAWIKIPCIGDIGSCTYDDLCETLSGAECPDPFVDNGVPCKCPFLKVGFCFCDNNMKCYTS